MTILVTGGAGFIGSALVLHLVRDLGRKVVTVDAMTYAANPLSLEPLRDDPRHRLVEADICEVGRMRALFREVRPEAGAHLAAESHFDPSITGSPALVLHLVRDLGRKVVTVDAMTYAANPLSLEPLRDDPRHRLVEADICDVGRMRALFGEVRPEAVVHLAAESHVDRSITGSGAF